MNKKRKTENCKIMWKPNFNLTTEKYTQVSGYIFNEKDELLIVKTKDNWTIPGGHPELYEYTIGTLIREVMEEACVSIKNIEYLGAVEVVEKGEKYYQLRYLARVSEVHEFKEEWEVSDRKFVKLEDLNKYITWSNGETFKAQIDSAKNNIGGKNENRITKRVDLEKFVNNYGEFCCLQDYNRNDVVDVSFIRINENNIKFIKTNDAKIWIINDDEVLLVE